MEKVIIIGAGPAGISAALYAVRGNLDPLVINNGIGALEKAEKIENYYGLNHPLSGQELYDTGIAQAKALGVRMLDAQVLGVGGFDTFVVKTTEGEFETQSLILATGSKRAAPKIPGVKEFEGKGVSYCAICDAFFYRGKDVAVLGNMVRTVHASGSGCGRTGRGRLCSRESRRRPEYGSCTAVSCSQHSDTDPVQRRDRGETLCGSYFQRRIKSCTGRLSKNL